MHSSYLRSYAIWIFWRYTWNVKTGKFIVTMIQKCTVSVTTSRNGRVFFKNANLKNELPTRMRSWPRSKRNWRAFCMRDEHAVYRYFDTTTTCHHNTILSNEPTSIAAFLAPLTSSDTTNPLMYVYELCLPSDLTVFRATR